MSEHIKWRQTFERASAQIHTYTRARARERESTAANDVNIRTDQTQISFIVIKKIRSVVVLCESVYMFALLISPMSAGCVAHRLDRMCVSVFVRAQPVKLFNQISKRMYVWSIQKPRSHIRSVHLLAHTRSIDVVVVVVLCSQLNTMKRREIRRLGLALRCLFAHSVQPTIYHRQARLSFGYATSHGLWISRLNSFH